MYVFTWCLAVLVFPADHSFSLIFPLIIHARSHYAGPGGECLLTELDARFKE